MVKRSIVGAMAVGMFLSVLALPVRAEGAETDALLTKDELQLTLRDLWGGHVFWVRSVVFAAHYKDAAAEKAAEAEAVENARAIADAIIPLYGQEAADALFDLLAGHYGAIKAYLIAANAGDSAKQQSAEKDLTANAEAIADFLDGANPNLPKNVVLPLLVSHGGHHLQQIQAVKSGDFTNEAVIWDAMLGHIHAIADAMANAFAAQFPDKITSR